MADMEKDIQNESEDLVDVFTLTDDETGEEQDFEIWARDVIDGQLYNALVPTDEESDEYVILKATEQDNEVFFETIDDDDEFYKVEEYFNDLLFGEVDYDEE
jgi:uncharacterized protein YrzB (UPF0473 family)